MKRIQIDFLVTFATALSVCSIIFLGYGLKVIIESSHPVEMVDQVLYVETIPETVTEVRTEREVVTIEVPPKPETDLSDEDMYLIASVVHAEAGNQDMVGKRLVADVILNRVDSFLFPNTVREVVEQEGQFQKAGSFLSDDLEAVELECKERLDHDVMFFRTGGYHKRGGELYQHGDHYFSAGR